MYVNILDQTQGPFSSPTKAVKLMGMSGTSHQHVYPEESFGSVLRKHREKRKLSRNTMARQTKLSSIYLYQLESGRRRRPSLRTIQRLAQVLQLSNEEQGTLAHLAGYSVAYDRGGGKLGLETTVQPFPPP